MKKNIVRLSFFFFLFFITGFGIGKISGNIEIRSKLNSEDVVPNKETALKIAKAIWVPIYGTWDVLFRVYNVQLTNNNIWIIEGGSFFPISGGGPYIQIDKKTGTILEVSHTK
jgi:hypothetical protein